MKEDQEQKCHVCRFCKQSFSNGKKLGGHMRGHLALISAIRNKGTQEINQEAINVDKGLDVFDDDDRLIKKSKGINQDYDTNGRKQGIQENDQQIFDGEKSVAFDDGDEIIKSSLQEMVVDQDSCGNAYVLRENPKRSWRVSNTNSNSSKDYVNLCIQCGKGFYSSKALATHKRSHSRKESSIMNSVCEKCGKGFDSLKALYGHMRCHSIKRPPPLDESSLLSSSEEHGDDDDDHGVANANPVRKKRSCTRYKSPKPNHPCTSLSSCGDYNDDEVEQGAICLMMLSRGVRNLEGVKLVISNQADFAFSGSRYSKTLENNVEFDVSVDGSMEFCEVKSKSKLGLKRAMIVESGSGHWKPDQTWSTLLKSKSTKKPRSCEEEFGMNRDATDSEVSLELKRRSKNHNCAVCFKGFGSGQALGSHKRVHIKTESEVTENNHIPDVNLNLEGGGINNGGVGSKLIWVHSDMEWDPLAMVN